jgi:membrane-associated phospholipid phosphatase
MHNQASRRALDKRRDRPARRALQAARARRRLSIRWSGYFHGRLGWVVHLLVLALFFALAIVAHGLRTDRFDVWVTTAIQRWTGLHGLMVTVSWFGYSPQDIIVDALGIGLLLALRRVLAAVWLLASMLGAAALTELFKFIVARPRPGANVVEVVRQVSNYSFPSGHVTSYVAFFGFLAALALLEVRHPVLRWVLAIPPLALVVLVGPSRVYLGAHWATDVIGGYLIGAFWLSIVLHTYLGYSRPVRSSDDGEQTGTTGTLAGGAGAMSRHRGSPARS